MYPSLRLPWSANPSASELTYRATSPHTVRTKGTIFLAPPPDSTLRDAFHAPPRPQTRMSAGAVALTKHFERNPSPAVHPRLAAADDNSDDAAAAAAAAAAPADTGGGMQGVNGRGRGKDTYKALKRRPDETHPFWVRPVGSNEEKTRLAGEVLERMLREARWRNVMLLHEEVAVYEVRMGRGWGMRWTLELVREDEEEEKVGEDGGQGVEGQQVKKEAREDGDMTGWNIGKVTFRGFLEPIAGLDHELEPEDAGEEEQGLMNGGATLEVA